MAFLKFSSGPLAGQVIDLALQTTTVGRAGDCDVILDENDVSSHHARIWAELKWYIEDTNSLNLTLLNGAEVDPNVPTQLETGDRLTFGTSVGTFDGVVLLASHMDRDAIAALDAAEKAIDGMGKDIQMLREAVEARDAAIADRDAAISQRDDIIRKHQAELKMKDGLMSRDSLDEELRKLREQIMAEAQKRIDAYQRETMEMQRRSVQANVKVEALEKALKEKDNELLAQREGRRY